MRPRIGVSACLLGEAVRYDGGHRRDPFVVDGLGPLVEWVSVCPEVELGLGVPRPTLRLAGDDDAPRMIVQPTGEDLTERMERYARAKVAELGRLGLDGYVLKSRSPSCGLVGVPVHDAGGIAVSLGRGVFARVLRATLPELPVEEECGLADAAVRERFLDRVLAAARRRAAAR